LIFDRLEQLGAQAERIECHEVSFWFTGMTQDPVSSL
jgi:hypothetical protein